MSRARAGAQIKFACGAGLAPMAANTPTERRVVDAGLNDLEAAMTVALPPIARCRFATDAVQ